MLGPHKCERRQVIIGRAQAATLERVMYQEHGESLADLVEQVKAASVNLERGDLKTSARLDAVTKSVDELYRKLGRPGSMECADDGALSERKDAIELCVVRHN